MKARQANPSARCRAVGRRAVTTAVVVLLAACASVDAPHEASQASPAVVTAPAVDPAAGASEDKLGIRVTALRLSAGGFMVDMRYRVTDAALARRLFDSKTPLYLEDAASGARFLVPNTAKLGKLRPGSKSAITLDRDYAMLFANPGSFLRSGARVRLVAGDAQLAHLTVH